MSGVFVMIWLDHESGACVMLSSGSLPQLGKMNALQLMCYFISVISCLKHHFLSLRLSRGVSKFHIQRRF